MLHSSLTLQAHNDPVLFPISSKYHHAQAIIVVMMFQRGRQRDLFWQDCLVSRCIEQPMCVRAHAGEVGGCEMLITRLGRRFLFLCLLFSVMGVGVSLRESSLNQFCMTA